MNEDNQLRASVRTLRVVYGPWFRRLHSLTRGKVSEKRLFRAVPGQPVSFTTDDGLRLSGRIYAADTSIRPAIVFLHSSDPAGQLHGLYLALAQIFVDAGYLVLTFNRRGYRGSDAPQDLRSFNMRQLASDVTAVITALLATGRAHPERIILYGHSRGAGIVLPALLADQRIWAGIMHCPPAWNKQRITGNNARDRALFVERFWRYLTVQEPIPESIFLKLAADLDLLSRPELLARRHAPFLILDGELEGDAVRAFGQTVLEQTPPPSSHITIPGADHYCNTANFGRLVIYDAAALRRLTAAIIQWLRVIETRHENQ